MSADPLTCLEDFQVKLDRARSLSKHMQTLALQANRADAIETLDMIDAISDALTHRMTSMMDEAEAAHRRLSDAMARFGSLAEVVTQTDSAGEG